MASFAAAFADWSVQAVERGEELEGRLQRTSAKLSGATHDARVANIAREQAEQQVMAGLHLRPLFPRAWPHALWCMRLQFPRLGVHATLIHPWGSLNKLMAWHMFARKP